MVHYNHFGYGQTLSTTLKVFSAKAAKAYFKATNSDSLGSISQRLSSISWPILVAIDGCDSDFHDNGAEALLKKPQYFFMLLKPAASDNDDAILAAQAEMEANALQIQAKLITESENSQNGLHGLMINSFTIRGIGPIGDSLYGVIMAFNIEYGIGTKINASYWV
jgi:hypothetical protein